jgi:hypothetical protein
MSPVSTSGRYVNSAANSLEQCKWRSGPAPGYETEMNISWLDQDALQWQEEPVDDPLIYSYSVDLS